MKSIFPLCTRVRLLRHTMSVSIMKLCAVFLFAALSAVPLTSWAGEGGGSHYTPGTRGDFAMAMIGPKGWYLRNELIYLDGKIGPTTLGNTVFLEAEQQVWLNTAKLSYLSDSRVLGGRFGAVLSIPLVIDADLSGEVAKLFPSERKANRSGLADMSVTGILNWREGNFNYNAGLSLYAPTGSYDADRILNLGRNYWTLNPFFAFTWMHPKRGYEVSLTTGYMVNSENEDTDYQSGSEFHVDFHLAQHFSSKFAIGVDGYYYKQLTDDEGLLLDQANALLVSLGKDSLGGFKGEAFGLGPAVKYTFTVGEKDITVIAKWLHDLDAMNRFETDIAMCAIAFKF
ncbi:transporter [Prosthecochloris sp.]|uniref:SphA family protein n=1 Tax=Prosthecochloris sp. TaxID=290513 RepID=UPI00257E00E2|nr:transporter [Prosthecochloris sp.]